MSMGLKIAFVKGDSVYASIRLPFRNDSDVKQALETLREASDLESFEKAVEEYAEKNGILATSVTRLPIDALDFYKKREYGILSDLANKYIGHTDRYGEWFNGVWGYPTDLILIRNGNGGFLAFRNYEGESVVATTMEIVDETGARYES